MGKITKIDPKDWKKANIVQIDVDAKDNREAIDALDNWAWKHGFARARENFLRIITRPDGTRIFRGGCYKLTDEEKTAIDLNFQAITKRAERIGGAYKSRR